MPVPRFSRLVFAATAAAFVFLLGGLMANSAMAQQHNSIFPAGWDNTVRDRLFMRIGYVSTFSRTKSGEVRDITGYVESRSEIAAAFDTAIQISQYCATLADPAANADCYRYDDNNNGSYWDLGKQILDAGFVQSGLDGLGTPPGIKASSQKQAGTVAVSIGYWLDEGRNWLLEGFVLAQPMTIKLYGDGVRSDGTPNSINGKEIGSTKLLPPLVIGSYNFGKPDSLVRPYVGLGVMYAIFFDTKTTPFLDSYQGGKTTISTRNTLGAGPFVGLQSAINDLWHVNVSVGQVGLRTTSRLVTSNTTINTGAQVISDLDPIMVEAIKAGEDLLGPQVGYGSTSNGVTTMIGELVARNKGQANLGTFVREQKMRITNTIVNVSVGRSF
jgi:outer membrane protein